MSISPLLMVYLVGIIVLLAVVAVLIFTVGFKYISYFLFGLGLVATVFSMFVLPLIFPWMNEGMGIGLLIVVIAGPLLAILSIVNVGVYISKYRQKTTTTIDTVFLILSGLLLLLVLSLFFKT